MRISKRRQIPSPALEVRDLRVLIALADSGTTSSAAATLHLTQSAVSRALAQAEARAGHRLFSRTPRGLVPTAACDRLLEHAPRLLDELVALERSLSARAPSPKRLRIVSQCYTAYPWLPTVLTHLEKHAPWLRLELALEHTADPCDALERGSIDLALLTSGEPAGTLARPLFADEIVFVVGKSHPLAGARHIERSDLAESTLLIADARADDAWFLKKVFGAKPPRLRAQRLPVTEALIELARAGAGIGVISEWIVGPHVKAGGLLAKRLARGPLLRPWHLAYRREIAKDVEPVLEALATLAPRSAARRATAQG